MRFALEWRDRRPDAPPPQRRFLDFIVDGRSLYEWHGADLIGCLGWADDALAAARLLRDAPPDLGNRTSIYICPVCGDLDCGALSVRITREGKEIVWSGFAMSSGAGHDEGQFDVPELRFDVREYWAAIVNRPQP
jgi:hypothetical protein